MTNLVSFSYMTRKQKETLKGLCKEQANCCYDHDNFERMTDYLQIGKKATFTTKNDVRVFIIFSNNLRIELRYNVKNGYIFKEIKRDYIDLEGEILDK